jgi:hypothetical protein
MVERLLAATRNGLFRIERDGGGALGVARSG